MDELLEILAKPSAWRITFDSEHQILNNLFAFTSNEVQAIDRWINYSYLEYQDEEDERGVKIHPI